MAPSSTFHPSRWSWRGRSVNVLYRNNNTEFERNVVDRGCPLPPYYDLHSILISVSSDTRHSPWLQLNWKGYSLVINYCDVLVGQQRLDHPLYHYCDGISSYSLRNFVFTKVFLSHYSFFVKLFFSLNEIHLHQTTDDIGWTYSLF